MATPLFYHHQGDFSSVLNSTTKQKLAEKWVLKWRHASSYYCWIFKIFVLLLKYSFLFNASAEGWAGVQKLEK